MKKTNTRATSIHTGRLPSSRDKAEHSSASMKGTVTLDLSASHSWAEQRRRDEPVADVPLQEYPVTSLRREGT